MRALTVRRASSRIPSGGTREGTRSGGPTCRRTCVGCGEPHPQAELLRMRRRSDGQVVFTARGGGGRSAYVCPKRSCFDRAVRRRALERSLRGPRGLSVSVDALRLWPEVVDELGRRIDILRRSGAGSSRSSGSRGRSGLAGLEGVPRIDRLTVLVALHTRLTTSGEVA